MQTRPYSFTVTENGDVYALARVTSKNANHDMVTAATSDFSAINRAVFTDKGTTVLASTVLTTSTVILSALSQGNIWTQDKTGFNFINSIPGDAFPHDGLYRIEYRFTLTGGAIFWLRLNATAEGLHST